MEAELRAKRNEASGNLSPQDWVIQENLCSRMIASFQEALKLRVRLFPLTQQTKASCFPRSEHPLCGLIQKSSSGRRNCIRDIHRATEISVKTGEPYIFQCHADMVEFAAAFPNRSEEVAGLVCGPLLLRQPDPFFKRDLLEKIGTLPIDRLALFETLPQIPVLNERRAQAAADLLFTIANYCAKADSLPQRKLHEISHQQALLAEELFQKKQGITGWSENDMSVPPSEIEFQKEKSLIDLIKLGDRKRAKAYLDDLLGTALFRSNEHIGILKARALEIVFMIARAAVEAGANLEEILGVKYQCLQKLSQDDSQETLYYFLMKAFDQLFECIYQNRNIQHTRIFSKAKEFIWKNYRQDVSLKTVAEVVGISPYYLSHLFRKEMGVSFSEYLKSVRISIAKNLLRETQRSILDICLEVGYQDPSHFAKIFKEKEGMKPTQFRKSLTGSG